MLALRNKQVVSNEREFGAGRLSRGLHEQRKTKERGSCHLHIHLVALDNLRQTLTMLFHIFTCTLLYGIATAQYNSALLSSVVHRLIRDFSLDLIVE